MKLFGYFRSSAAYRVRIALNLKGLDYDPTSLNLRDGEQRSEAYLKINPQGLVPYLVDGDIRISQSMAMLEYLDEAYPDVALLPKNMASRAYVRALANIIACDVHPLNNLRVLNYISQEFGASAEQKNDWYCHWVSEAFCAFEALLEEGEFCHGNTPGLADVCLVPQVYNARRFKCALDDFPRIIQIVENCNKLPAFMDALPENQPDAP